MRLPTKHWEADTVLGKQGTGVLVTQAKRKSRLYLVKRVWSKLADVVRDAIIEMLRPYAEHVHTITFDNGGEFAGHKAIEAALEANLEPGGINDKMCHWHLDRRSVVDFYRLGPLAVTAKIGGSQRNDHQFE